jgi:uncharacterized protein
MTSFRLLVYVFVSALMLAPQPGRADITPIDYTPPPSGGGVSPRNPHPSIRLDDQEVIIRLKRGEYTVDAVFHLFNTGEKSTEWIGFPKNPAGRLPGPLGRVDDFIRFDVWVNGNKVPFADERDLIKSAQNVLQGLRGRRVQYTGWLMGQASFPGHVTTTIRVSYASRYGNCGMNCAKAVYIYGTGGYWKDNIGKATFIVDGMQRGGAQWAGASFGATETDKYLIHRRLLSESLAQYEIRDFEPSPDGALTFMFTSRFDGEDGDTEALVHAAMNGRLEQVQALLDKGVDVNAKGIMDETPLMKAAWGGHLKVAKLLVEKGADVNAETKHGQTALKSALSNAWMNREQVDVARFLQEQGAKSTTLAVAAFVGDKEAVERFLAEGSSLNQKATVNEPSPLFAAAMGGQPEVLTLLLDKGAEIDAKNRQGQTPLMAAAAANQVAVAKVLLDRGAHVNAEDAFQRSPLNHAVWLRGHVEVARLLLERGADIKQRDDPVVMLMHASQSGHVEIVKLLVEKGADVNAKDGNGNTAMSLARGPHIEEIEKILKAHGAKK